MPAVCFVAPGAYGALAGRPDLRHIGGAEVQQRLLARELVRRGHRVTFVTLDHGQPEGVTHDGVRVVKMCGWEDGWPGIRFLHPRWTSLWSALGRAGADVYYQRGAGVETGQVALWCRRRRRPFVFGVASDMNCVAELPDLAGRRERGLYRYGLRRASGVVCQTETQKEALARAFSVPSRLIRSCAEDPLSGASVPPRSPAPAPRALWVGRFNPVKRFELLLDLAEACPSVTFEVLGGQAGDSGYAGGLVARARSLANVVLAGWVAPDQVGEFYDRASALVCTSVVEGFPNTFLEAWSRGVPTVTTVDPDGLVGRHGLGGVGTGAAGLKSALEALHASGDVWHEASARARAHFLAHHTPAAAVDGYERLFLDVRGSAWSS